MTESFTVPLFVLPMGIFPMCKEPLRVFEPRYKQMLDDCVLNNSEFGYIAGNVDGGSENGWSLPAEYGVLTSAENLHCLLYTSPSPRDLSTSRMPSSA